MNHLPCGLLLFLFVPFCGAAFPFFIKVKLCITHPLGASREPVINYIKHIYICTRIIFIAAACVVRLMQNSSSLTQ
jgi:hypothetical protein